ncbi:MAG: hypothetical protein P9L91_08910 [Candidatus Zophobacter franzmannii]|nr:hypothetical protein [Candidatus Zophobacter franzmannii]
MTKTTKENLKQFKSSINGLNRIKRPIYGRGTSELANRMGLMLRDLKSSSVDPLLGVELIASFYETDQAVLSNCDDSTGYVSDIYKYEAPEYFKEYAKNCDGKEKIAEIILKLNLADDFGVRDSLIDCAGEFLPESVVRVMIEKLQILTDEDKNKDEDGFSRFFYLIESLARQIGDAKLYEETCKAHLTELSGASIIDIGRVYLESGDGNTALTWANKISEKAYYMANERERLLVDIYKELGDGENLIEILHHRLRREPTIYALDKLLKVIGTDKRDSIVTDEVDFIMNKTDFRKNQSIFLVEVNRYTAAEEYLIRWADHINGDFYDPLLPIVKILEKNSLYLAASLIYRRLLISILEKGYTKAYSHGVKYLKKLDQMAKSIIDWRGCESHIDFKDKILQKHRYKRSFLSKYESGL